MSGDSDTLDKLLLFSEALVMDIPITWLLAQLPYSVSKDHMRES